MSSIVRQFDFYDVIYHVQPCNTDIRQCNFVFQLMDVQKIHKSKQYLWEIQDCGIFIYSEGIVHNVNLFECYNQNKFCAGKDLLLSISLSVGQSYNVHKSLSQ